MSATYDKNPGSDAGLPDEYKRIRERHPDVIHNVGVPFCFAVYIGS